MADHSCISKFPATINPNNIRHSFLLLVLLTTLAILLYIALAALSNSNHFAYGISFILTKMKNNSILIDNILSLEKPNQNCSIMRSPVLVSQYVVEIDGETYPKSIPLFMNKSIDFACLRQSSTNNDKLILAWNRYFNVDDDYFRRSLKNRRCPVQNCEITSDRRRLNESDLVLVHMVDKFEPIPKFRPEKQRWVLIFV